MSQSQITFPTEAEFPLEALEGVAQAHPTLKWRQLEVGRVYGITRMTLVKTRFGPAKIGHVVRPLDGWERHVWLPERLAAEISKMTPPVFVRPLGLRNAKSDPTKSYHHYQLYQ